MSDCNTPSSDNFPSDVVIDGEKVAVDTSLPSGCSCMYPGGNSRSSPQTCGNCGRCNSGNTVSSPSRTWVDGKSEVLINSEEGNVGLSSCVLL